MRLYELVLVFKSSLAEEKRKKLVESIKTLLKDFKTTKEEEWGQKELSYPIKKEKSGFYLYYAFEGEKAVPNDIEKKFLINEDILRHLLLRRK